MYFILLVTALLVVSVNGGANTNPFLATGFVHDFSCYNWINKHVPIEKPVQMCGEDDMKWWDLRRSCLDQNLQLCSLIELCPHRDNVFTNFHLEPSDRDKELIPISDERDDWMLATPLVDADVCDVISDPVGGNTNTYKDWKFNYYCCPKCTLKRFWVGHHMTWDMAKDFCERQTMIERWEHKDYAERPKQENDPYQMRLCRSDQICRGDTPRWMFNVISDVEWSPVADSPNEWVMTAPGESDTCVRYSDKYGGNKPSWGQDATCNEEWKGFVSCCAIRPRHAGYLAVERDESNNDDVQDNEPEQDVDKYANSDRLVELRDSRRQASDPERRFYTESATPLKFSFTKWEI